MEKKTVDEVKRWLHENGLGMLSDTFQENLIDGEALNSIIQDDQLLKELVPQLGLRAKVKQLACKHRQESLSSHSSEIPLTAETTKPTLNEVRTKLLAIREQRNSSPATKKQKIAKDRYVIACGVKDFKGGQWVLSRKFRIVKLSFDKDNDHSTVIDIMQKEFGVSSELGEFYIVDMKDNVVDSLHFSIFNYIVTNKKYIGTTRMYLGVKQSSSETNQKPRASKTSPSNPNRIQSSAEVPKLSGQTSPASRIANSLHSTSGQTPPASLIASPLPSTSDQTHPAGLTPLAGQIHSPVPSSSGQTPPAGQISSNDPSTSGQTPPAGQISSNDPSTSDQTPQAGQISSNDPSTSGQTPPASLIASPLPFTSGQTPPAGHISSKDPSSSGQTPPAGQISSKDPSSSGQTPPAGQISSNDPSTSDQTPQAGQISSNDPSTSDQTPPAGQISSNDPSTSGQTHPAGQIHSHVPSSSGQTHPAGLIGSTDPSSSCQTHLALQIASPVPSTSGQIPSPVPSTSGQIPPAGQISSPVPSLSGKAPLPEQLSSDAGFDGSSFESALNCIRRELLEQENRGKCLDDGELLQVDTNLFFPVHSSDPCILAFMSQRGRDYRRVTSGYGEFLCVPNEDMTLFEGARDDGLYRDIFLIDSALLYFMSYIYPADAEAVLVYQISDQLWKLTPEIADMYREWKENIIMLHGQSL